jgi:hypothetical protein
VRQGFSLIQRSDFINLGVELLAAHAPEIVARLGRNSNDTYEVTIEGQCDPASVIPFIWSVAPRGSFFVPFLGWGAVRVRTQGEKLWVGLEVIIPHPSRGVYVEACYGRFDREVATSVLKAIKGLQHGISLENAEMRIGKGAPVRCDPDLRKAIDAAVAQVEAGLSVDRSIPSFSEVSKRPARSRSLWRMLASMFRW